MHTGIVWLIAGFASSAILSQAVSGDEPPCFDGFVDTFNRGCAPAPCCCKGDSNCDNRVDFDDIDAFVDALGGATPCSAWSCDITDDGRIDFEDINPFVEILSASGGPCPMLAAWSPIAPGEAVYGTSGTYDLGGHATRDEDWYACETSTGDQIWTLAVTAEFAVEARVIFAGDCELGTPASHGTVALGAADPGTPLVLATRCLPAGRYWFVVRPQPGSSVPCGTPYTLLLTTTPACGACVFDYCAGADHVEAEPCGEDANGGCDGTLEVFEDLGVLAADEQTRVCGTLWANEGARESDWYRWSVDTNVRLDCAVLSEIPVRVSLLAGPRRFTPFCADLAAGRSWTQVAAACSSTMLSTDFSEPFSCGTPYWLVVWPEDPLTGPLFLGYPCALEQSGYRIDLWPWACT